MPKMVIFPILSVHYWNSLNFSSNQNVFGKKSLTNAVHKTCVQCDWPIGYGTYMAMVKQTHTVSYT